MTALSHRTEVGETWLAPWLLPARERAALTAVSVRCVPQGRWTR